MREIRMCVVFCLQMKKKSLDFLFGGHFKKKREKGREKREILFYEKSLQFYCSH